MIQDTRPVACELYSDIIDLPHWRSPKRRPMSAIERASQFSAFNALAGYEDMVDEEARFVGDEEVLSETALEELNEKLLHVAGLTERGLHPVVTIRYFIPDASKEGGSYAEITEAVRRVDPIRREIELMRRVGLSERYMTIALDRISDITPLSE